MKEDRVLAITDRPKRLPRPHRPDDAPALIEWQVTGPDLIEEYLRYLIGARGHSQYTAMAYGGDLRRFQTFLGDSQALGSVWLCIDRATVRRYVRMQTDRGLSRRSASRHVSAIKSFYRFLDRFCEIHNSQILGIKPLKFQSKLPRWLTQREIDRVFVHLEERAKAGQQKDLRNLAMIELLYSTGMRLGELVEVRMDDFDVNDFCLRVGRRKNRQRLRTGRTAGVDRYRSAS